MGYGLIFERKKMRNKSLNILQSLHFYRNFHCQFGKNNPPNSLQNVNHIKYSRSSCSRIISKRGLYVWQLIQTIIWVLHPNHIIVHIHTLFFHIPHYKYFIRKTRNITPCGTLHSHIIIFLFLKQSKVYKILNNPLFWGGFPCKNSLGCICAHWTYQIPE